MSDVPPPPNTALPAPGVVQIPPQILEQWVKIPSTDKMLFSLTRQDIDNLIFGMLRNADALSALDRLLVQWSSGNLAEANAELSMFRHYHGDSQNHYRQFATAVMLTLLEWRQNAGGRT